MPMACGSTRDPLRKQARNGNFLRMTPPTGTGPLDEIDRRLVAALRTNARATFAQLGDEVGLSAPAAKRRVDRLVAVGTISAFTVVIDPRALGWHTEAYVEVLSASTVSGAPDALVHILARDVQHLEQTIQRIRGFPHVTSTKTEFVLSRLVQREQ
jgi:DNA-binding Lrp family transcriptional regulator